MATAEKIEFSLPPPLPPSLSPEAVLALLADANALPVDSDDGSTGTSFSPQTRVTMSPTLNNPAPDDGTASTTGGSAGTPAGSPSPTPPATPAGSSNPTPPAPTPTLVATLTPEEQKSLIDALLEMMEKYENAEVTLSGTQAIKSGNRKEIADALANIIDIMGQELKASGAELVASRKQGETLSNVAEGFGWVLTAFVFAATFYFAGPLAALATGAVMVVLQSKVLDKPLKNLFDTMGITNPAIQGAIKIGIALVFSVATGSAAGALDSVIAAGVEVAAGTAASVGDSLVTSGLDVVTDVIVDTDTTLAPIADDVAVSGTTAGFKAIARQAAPTIIQIFVQSALSMGVADDLAKGIAEWVYSDDKEGADTCETVIAAVLTVTMAFAAALICGKVANLGQAAAKLSKALPQAAENYGALKPLNFLVNVAGTPAIYQTCMFIFQVGGAGVGIGRGVVTLDQADIKEEQAVAESLLEMAVELSEGNTQAMYRSNQTHKTTMESMMSCNERWPELTQYLAHAAQQMLA